MEIDLARDQIGADGSPVLHYRDGRLVARGFDPEDDHPSARLE
jgi:hypothetical protein